MKFSPALSKLMSLARIARAHIELLAEAERREVGDDGDGVAGYCGIAARYLELLSNDAGIHPVFCAGEFRTYSRMLGEYKTKSGHAWIKYSNYIVDITANQFENIVSRIERDFSKSVYVCRTTNPHFFEQYVGPVAREVVARWYAEPLDELCEKTKTLASNSKLKLSYFRGRGKFVSTF